MGSASVARKDSLEGKLWEAERISSVLRKESGDGDATPLNVLRHGTSNAVRRTTSVSDTVLQKRRNGLYESPQFRGMGSDGDHIVYCRTYSDGKPEEALRLLSLSSMGSYTSLISGSGVPKHNACVVDYVVLTIVCGIDSLFLTLFFQLPNMCTSPSKSSSFFQVAGKEAKLYVILHNVYAMAIIASYLTFSISFVSHKNLSFSVFRLAIALLLASVVCFAVAICEILAFVPTLPLLGSVPVSIPAIVALCFLSTFTIAMGLPLFCLLTPKAVRLVMWGRLFSLILVTSIAIVGVCLERASAFIAFSVCGLLTSGGAVSLLWLSRRGRLDNRVDVVRHALKVEYAPAAGLRSRSSTAALYRDIWIQLANLFLTFLVTYTLFPAIHPEFVFNYSSSHFVRKCGSIALSGCFFLANYLGSITPCSMFVARYFSAVALSRLAYIPIYRTFVLVPEHEMNLLVLFTLHFTFGFSNGLGLAVLQDLVNHEVPRYPDQQKAQFFSGVYCIIGILFGTIFTNFLTCKGYFAYW